MGGCTSQVTAEEKDLLVRSKELEKFLKHQKKGEVRKLLLLGTGDAGKSTFLRQLKVMSGIGLDQEKVKFKPVIRDNILSSMQTFVLKMHDNEVLPSKLVDQAQVILDADKLDGEVAKAVVTTWKNNKVKQLYADFEREMQIPCTSPNLWTIATKCAKESYVPEDEHIFLAKLRTTGFSELAFDYDGVDFVVVDVGGQRSERKKWLHCFDNVNAVIFLCAISEYDGQLLEEAEDTTRIGESVSLFSNISDYFPGLPFILFFNKRDLFEDKIKVTTMDSLSEMYPDFPEFADKEGGSDYDNGIAYFRDKFTGAYKATAKETLREEDVNLRLFPFETCALDTNQCQLTFDSIKQNIVDTLLTDLFAGAD